MLKLKDLGEVSKLFGIQLNKIKMVMHVAKSARLEGAYAVRCSITNDEPRSERALPSVPDRANDGLSSIQEFQPIVGSLLWMARSTRPNIGLQCIKLQDSPCANVTGLRFGKAYGATSEWYERAKAAFMHRQRAHNTSCINSYTDADG